MDGHTLITKIRVRKLDQNSCEGLHLQGFDRFTRKLEKPMGKTPYFSQSFMELMV